MTVNELIEQLQALVAEDEFRGDAAVAFGSDMEPVEGGSSPSIAERDWWSSTSPRRSSTAWAASDGLPL